MKDYIENNIEIVKELIQIDFQIMKQEYPIDTLLNHALEQSNLKLSNAFIIYDGNPLLTLKLVNSEIENSLIYPNGSFLAINKFITSYKDTIHLCMEQNDFKYEQAKDVFDTIVVVNDEILFSEMQQIYPNIKYIKI